MVDLGKTEARLPKKEQSQAGKLQRGRSRALRDQERGQGREEGRA